MFQYLMMIIIGRIVAINILVVEVVRFRWCAPDGEAEAAMYSTLLLVLLLVVYHQEETVAGR